MCSKTARAPVHQAGLDPAVGRDRTRSTRICGWTSRPAHPRPSSVLTLESGGDRAVFVGDLIHTAAADRHTADQQSASAKTRQSPPHQAQAAGPRRRRQHVAVPRAPRRPRRRRSRVRDGSRASRSRAGRSSPASADRPFTSGDPLSQNNTPVVRTPLGAVRGVRDHGGERYRAIPYAATPTGAARFAPPAPHPDGTASGTRRALGRRRRSPSATSALSTCGPTSEARAGCAARTT